jgi:hypothetical protein
MAKTGRPKLYGFVRDDAKVLKAIAQANRIGRSIGASGGFPSQIGAGGPAAGAWVMQATSSITAAAYSPYLTPGSGTAKIMRLDTNLIAHQDNEQDVTVTVYSMLPHAILDDGLLMVIRTLDGVLWVTQWLDFPQVFCRFKTTASFTTSSASVAGTIQAMYGMGRAHGTTTGRTFYNLADNTDSAYIFEGGSGDAGFAVWDSGSNWRIIQMECP